MKMILDFKCRSCDKVTEEYTDNKSTSLCECGSVTDKMLSAPSFHLEGYSGSFPGAAMQWDKKHKTSQTK
jgi:hypothetical protein|tara:strand:+ start:369 stop:578 length:210 start_codon:yes stop_codon:yes gene_type:complete